MCKKPSCHFKNKHVQLTHYFDAILTQTNLDDNDDEIFHATVFLISTERENGAWLCGMVKWGDQQSIHLPSCKIRCWTILEKSVVLIMLTIIV